MANNSKSRQNFSQVALYWSLKEKLYLLVEGVGAGVIKKGSEVKEQTCLAERGVGGSPLLPGTGI